jgi:uncharacterized repeat protein (TIGR03803 family)
VFRLTPAGDYTKLYTFSGNLTSPKASLIEAADGCLYGTTVGGAYRITTNGVFTTLFEFPGGQGGGFCLAPLVQGTDGNLYGTTQGGEPYNSGIVFQVTTNGVFTLLHQLTTRADGMGCNGTLLPARDGSLYGTTQFGGAYGPGTIFKLGLNGIMSIIHDFNFSDGALPGALVQDLAGNLYGTTAPFLRGGPGTVFRLTTNGTFTTIYSFTGGADGSQASGTLVYSTDGDLYGVTPGTVFRLTTAGTLTTIYSFGGGLDGASPNALVQATDGAFYGTTGSGGAGSNGTVFRITSAGAFNSLYSFTGHGDGGAPTSLLQASDGMFYGTATQGGIAGYGTLFRVSTNGSFLPLYSFSGGSDGAHPTASLMQAKDGWLYGSTSSGGSFGGGTIFRITTSGDFELLYSFSGDDGVVPGALVEATDGWLYGTTSSGGVSNYGTLFRILLSDKRNPQPHQLHPPSGIQSRLQLPHRNWADLCCATECWPCAP